MRSAALVATPPVIVTFLMAALVCGEMRGATPFTVPGSLSEVAALGDLSTAARLLERGASPDVEAVVPPGVLGVNAVMATPLEAAVLARDVPMFTVLVMRSTMMTRSGAHLSCLASDVALPDLAQQLGDGPSRVPCVPGASVAVVFGR